MNKNKEVANLAKIVAGNEKSQWHEKFEKNRIQEDGLDRSVDIALAIADRIEELGMSQKELAEVMGTSAQYINKVLKGRQNLTLNSISAFEKLLAIQLIEVRPSVKGVNEGEIFVYSVPQASFDHVVLDDQESKANVKASEEELHGVNEVNNYALAA